MGPGASEPRTDRPLPPGARVLVIRLSALGDVLFALETVASLKAERPDVVVDFATEDRFAAVLDRHPELDRVLPVPRKRRSRYPALLRTLRAVRYDAVLDLSGLLKSIPVVLAARATRKLGMAPPAAREGAHRFVGEVVPMPEPLPHRADRGLLMLRALGLSGRRVAPRLGAPEREPAFWDPADARRRIVLHPGASAFAAFKRWPASQHAELARRLVHEGHDVAVSFGPGEGPLAEAVLTAAPGSRPLDGSAIGLLGLAAICRVADCVVAADTGPLHLAAAAGAPVVALFGPKDHRLYGPRGEGHEILWADVPCRPCRRRRCASPQCVLGIEVEEALAAVRRRLAAPSTAAR